jgi:hypothetical protein
VDRAHTGIGGQEKRARSPKAPPMNTDDAALRRYCDRELNAIIRRAVELQHAAHGREEDDLASGVTLRQLQALAAEAGIAPELVARAAAELEARGDPHEYHFWGGPAAFTVERTLDGEIPEEAWEDLVAEVADSLHGSAPPVRVGGLLDGRDASTRIRIRSDRGRTRIAVRSKYGDAVPAVPITVLLLAGVAAIIILGKGAGLGPAAPLAAAGSLAAGFLASRAVVGHLYRKSRKEMSSLVNRLSRRLEPLLTPRAVAEQPPVRFRPPVEETQEVRSGSS